MNSHFSEVADKWNNKVWAQDKEFALDIVKFADLRGDEIALYVGVGTGEIATKFNVAEMTGLDICKEMMEENKVLKRHRLIVSDAHNLPFLDNSFDFAFARNLLKHVERPRRVISEMKRVVKEGGIVFTAESCVLKKEDKSVPNYCVRTTEPDHFSFQTHDEIIGFYKFNRFTSIEDTVYKYRSKWLKKWVKSSKATDEVRKKILMKYQYASKSFINRHGVKFTEDGDIKSTIFWSFVKGTK